MTSGLERWTMVLLMGLLLTPLPTLGQQPPPPVSVSGTVGSGYFRQTSDDRSFSTIPFQALFKVNGYWGHPDFLSYYANPTLGFGTQVPLGLGGFNAGNGFSSGFSFLRRRRVPINFTYGKFFSPNQFTPSTSGFALSKTEKTQWGLSSAVRIPGINPLRIRFQNVGTTRKVEGVSVDLGRRSRNLNVDTGKNFRGWKVAGRLSAIDSSTDVLVGTAQGINPADFQRDDTTLRVNLNSPVMKGNHIRAQWGRNDSSSALGQTENNNLRNSYRAELNSRWTTRLSTGVFVRKTGGTQERFLPFAPGAAPPGGGNNLFLGITDNDSTGLGGRVTFLLREGFRVFGGMSSVDGTIRTLLPTETVSTSRQGTTKNVGVDFTNNFYRGNIQAEYSLANSDIQRIADPRFGGTLDRKTTGHSASLGISQKDFAKLDRFSVRTYFSRENLESGVTFLNSQIRTDVQGEKHFRDFDIGATVGFANTKTDSDLVQKATGLSYSFLVKNHRFNLTYSHRDNDSTLLLGGLPGAPGLPLETNVKSSSDTLSGMTNPIRSIPIRFQWVRGKADFSQGNSTSYSYAQIGAQYRYRLLILEGGVYYLNNEIFQGSSTQRSDIYFRVSREFVLF
jgi:hypothetical protein